MPNQTDSPFQEFLDRLRKTVDLISDPEVKADYHHRIAVIKEAEQRRLKKNDELRKQIEQLKKRDDELRATVPRHLLDTTRLLPETDD